jgi:hypothetical protein
MSKYISFSQFELVQTELQFEPQKTAKNLFLAVQSGFWGITILGS